MPFFCACDHGPAILISFEIQISCETLITFTQRISVGINYARSVAQTLEVKLELSPKVWTRGRDSQNTLSKHSGGLNTD